MERARGSRAEANTLEDEEEAGAVMAAVVAAAGGTGPAVMQVAGLYRGLCAVRSRVPGLGLVSPAQLRVFPVRCGSGRPAGGNDGSRVGTDLEANPFYDRYRDKIQQLRRCGPRRAGGGQGRGEARGLRFRCDWRFQCSQQLWEVGGVITAPTRQIIYIGSERPSQLPNVHTVSVRAKRFYKVLALFPVVCLWALILKTPR